MTRPRLGSRLFLGLLFTGCGGGSAPQEPAQPEPVGTIARGARTVVLVLFDSARTDHLAPYGYALDTTPNLTRFAAESVVFEDALAAVTGTNAGLASLFTGLHAQTHGVGSLRDLGQHALAARHVTLAERFREGGFRTIGLVSLPQLSSRLFGLMQGFDTIVQPGLNEDEARTAFQSFFSVKQDLALALASDEPVFAFLHFADARSHDAAPGAVGGQFLAPNLAPFAEQSDLLRGAVARATEDPEAGVVELGRLLGRGRGSPEWEAYRAALYDGQLAFVDEYLGLLFELLREHGRYDDAIIAVLATQGGMITPPKATTGPAFPPWLVRLPFIVRLPGGVPAARVPALVQPIDLAPTFAELFGWDAADEFEGQSLLPLLESGTPVRSIALCEDAGMERRVTFDERFHVEQNSISETSVYARETGWLQRESDLSPEDVARVTRLREALTRFARPEEWTVSYGKAGGTANDAIAPLEVKWRFARGLSLGSRVDGGDSVDSSTSGASTPAGHASLMGLGSTVTIRGSRRDLPVKVTLANERRGVEAHIFVGGTALVDSLMPYLPSDTHAPWPDDGEGGDAPWGADIEHHGSSWWNVRVGGGDGGGVGPGREVTVLLTLFPPGKIDERLEIMAGAEIEVQAIPGRVDAVIARGVSPFLIQIKKTPRREIGIAVHLDGKRVDARAIRYRGRPYSPIGECTLYLPDWMAGVTDALDLPAPEMRALPPGAIQLLRRGTGVPPADRAPLDEEWLRFVRFLQGSE